MAASSVRQEIHPGSHASRLLVRISASASLALVCASAHVVHAGINVWTRSAMPAVHALVIDPVTPQTLYAGTGQLTDQGLEGGVFYEGGVFKSIDGGRTWNPASEGLNVNRPDYSLRGDYVTALVIDPAVPTTLYAGGRGQLFKSTDAANHWSPTTLVACNIEMLVIDPISPNPLYAVTSPGPFVVFNCKMGGTFKSVDHGDTWNAAGAGTQALAVLANAPLQLQTQVTAIAIDPTMPDTLYVGTGYALFKSTDGANSWQAINNGLTTPGDTTTYVKAVAVDPVTPDTLYAGVGAGVFKSTDGGSHWAPFNVGLTDYTAEVLAIDPRTPTTLYAGTLNGVYAIEQGQPDCVGDCTSAVGVFVDDLVTLASIALGVVEPAACPSGLPLGGTVDVAVLVDAVNNALSGCAI